MGVEESNLGSLAPHPPGPTHPTGHLENVLVDDGKGCRVLAQLEAQLWGQWQDQQQRKTQKEGIRQWRTVGAAQQTLTNVVWMGVRWLGPGCMRPTKERSRSTTVCGWWWE